MFVDLETVYTYRNFLTGDLRVEQALIDMRLRKGILSMRLRAFIIRLIMCAVAAGFLISPAYSADKKIKKSATNDARGLKVVSKGNGRRIALVIGNGDYKNTGHLANPVNDARLMAETLKKSVLNCTTESRRSTFPVTTC